MAASSTSASTSWSTRPDAERAEALEQRRDLAQVVARAGRRPAREAALVVGSEKDEVGAAAAAEPDAVARCAARTRVTGSPLTKVPYRDSLSRSR